ncbi:amidohydrolase [Fodinicurvata sp. EGI_FJ10296]|uniref:amidohydrolase family protein n=1 Tax=Fodinicurvata sp. EGI_FJ10296 TaxID=3231908 RepID=UPI003453DDC8
MPASKASILFENATVLPCTGTDAVVSPGFVAVGGETILAVGAGDPSQELRAEAAEIIDCGGDIVMPGMVNTHGHLPMSLFRGLGDDEPDRLRRYIFPLEAKLVSPEMVRVGTRLAAAELIAGGVTCAADMYYFEPDIADALAPTGLRAVLGETIVDFKAPDGQGPDAGFKLTEDLIAATVGNPLLTATIAPHAPYTTGENILRRCAAFAENHDIGVQSHLSEMPYETTWVSEKYGTTPTGLYDRCGLLNERLIAAHCLTVSESDIALLGERSVGVAINSGANAKAGKGIAPALDLITAGARVGLGSDGPMSGNTIDLFAQMDMIAKMQKMRANDRTVMPAWQAVTLATSGGADALGLGDRIGRLAPGYQADIIRIDTRAPRFHPRHDPYAALVYAARPGDVRDSMVAGRWLMRDRDLLTLDLAGVTDDATRLANLMRAAIDLPAI